jgi:hypothetical protein
MQDITRLIQTIPIELSALGGILMLASMAILIIKNGKLGKLKLLVEAIACLGAVFSAPIVLLTLIG